MAIGRGVRLMAGRGLDTSRGGGRLITTVAGSITITTGPGYRAASFNGGAVGGGPRSSRSWSTSHSATTFAGIHCRITTGIHIQIAIVTTIVIAIGIEIGIEIAIAIGMVAVVIDIRMAIRVA